MEDTVYLALSKSLNYVVTPAILPIEDICRVEQVMGVLQRRLLKRCGRKLSGS
jgi:hypothetical protein